MKDLVPMKKTTLVLSLFLVFLFADSPFAAEAIAQVWDNAFYIVSTVKTGDSGYAILVINNYPMDSLDRNYSLVKIDALGREEWNQTYTLYGNSHLSSLVYTSDGGYALAGSKDFSTYGEQYSLNGRGFDFWLVKTDKFGNIEWDRTYGGSWHESASSVVETSDGEYALAGYTWSYGEGLWLVKTDSNGTLLWQQTYVGNSITDMVQTADKGFAFITSSPTYLIKTNNNGTMEWSIGIGDPTQPILMLQTSDKGYAILCNVYTGYFETVYYSLTKVDMNGNIQWRQNYTKCHINSFAEESSGGFVLAGSFINTNSTLPWIAKTNATGNLIWNGALGNYTGSISSVIETNDGDFFVVGISNSSIWIAKTDANGNVRTPSPEPQPQESFPITLVGVSIALVFVVAVVLLVYFKKRNK
jgi:hypothetical protein